MRFAFHEWASIGLRKTHAPTGSTFEDHAKITEYEEKGSIKSEGYQYGKALGKEKTSALKYSLMGSGMGFVSTTLAIFPGIPSFVVTPYLLKGSKMPEEAYQKAQASGPE